MVGLKKRRLDWSVKPRFATSKVSEILFKTPVVYEQPPMKRSLLKATKVRKVRRRGKVVWIPIL